MSLRRSTALRDALHEWVNEGLITAESASTITVRYELDREAVWYKSTSFMIGLVASILVTAGLVLLISENWHHLSVPIRMLTGIIPWLAAAILTIRATYYQPQTTDHKPPTTDHKPRTAEAWGFLASLLFGVNIFLQAQIFHLSGYWPTAIMWWAAGSLAMGAVLRSPSIIALSQILALIWIDNETGYQHFTPTVFAGVALIAAASMQRLTRLTATGLIALLCWALYHAWNGITAPELGFNIVLIYMVLGVLAIALYEWAEPISRRFRTTMVHILSAWTLLMALIASTTDAADDVWLGHGDWLTATVALIASGLLLVVRRDIIAYGLSAVVLWTIGWSFLTPDPWLTISVAGLNLILFGTAVFMLWSGIKHAKKSDFMSALVLVTALAFARFLDYFEDYVLGAVVFMSAGILLFLANTFWNRRYAKH